eukprot:scaffold21859_cov119-Isochrysis_galbana.AAC.2
MPTVKARCEKSRRDQRATRPVSRADWVAEATAGRAPKTKREGRRASIGRSRGDTANTEVLGGLMMPMV